MSSSMRSSRTRKFKADINVVPYIDVMLVLLVIFMVASPVTNPGVINLPTAEKSSLPPTEYIQISLKPDAASTIGINGQKNTAATQETTSSRKDLLERLKALHEANPDLPVMISGDKESRYDEVISLISEAKKFGITRVGLATKS